MRWGPVVASAVASLALLAAGILGISAFDGDAGEEFGLVRLDGLVGETLMVLALALTGVAVAFALRRLPSGAVIAVGIVTAIAAFISRSSLAADAESVTEYITGAGSADGIDSRLVTAVDGRVTRVDVDPALALLAMAGAAALVAVGWVAWVELDERRQRSRQAAGAGSEGPGSEPLTDPSQLPHT